VPICPPIFCAKFPPQPRPSLFVRSVQRFAQVEGRRFMVEVNSRDTDSGSSFHLPLLALHQIPPVPFHFPPAPFHRHSESSGRRDLNSPAKADIYPVAERHSRLRGRVSTQVIQPGGDPAKVGGGVWGPMGGGRSWGANPGPP
jgi:hypothetical protein